MQQLTDQVSTEAHSVEPEPANAGCPTKRRWRSCELSPNSPNSKFPRLDPNRKTLEQLVKELRQQRESLELSVAAVDARVGYTANGSTTRYENFRRKMSLQHFIDQANAVGLDVRLVPFEESDHEPTE